MPKTAQSTLYRDFVCQSVWIIALLTLLVHLAVAGRYDFFRNELYFIVCGRHPDFGYVDQPPIIPFVAAATQLFGESVWLLRLPAALAAAALIPVTAALTRLLGGNDRAACIAGLAAAIAPALIALTSTLGTPTFEPVIWTLIGYFVLRADVRGDRSALLWAGLTAGIALEIKYSVAVWLAGLLTGVGLTEARRLFAFREFWLGLLIAILLAAPSLIWQQIHGWPFLAIVSHHSAEGSAFLGTPVQFLMGQALSMNIALAPLWIMGLAAPFLGQSLRPARILATAALVVGASIYVAHGKNYYLFPIFPSLFAAGAAGCSKLNRWAAAAWMTVAAALALPILPVVLPIFTPHHLEHYLARTHLAPKPEEAAAIGAPITQIFSDEFGWRNLEQQVARTYHALPADEQAHAAILASNYGEAAAIDVLGKKDKLPPALSGHNQYFFWDVHGGDARILILVADRPEPWRDNCGSLIEGGNFGVRYAMPYERDQPIFICRNFKSSLKVIWPQLMRFQ
jgi:Dolichyl-phosphate-mannose-protein mannosyltransferase